MLVIASNTGNWDPECVGVIRAMPEGKDFDDVVREMVDRDIDWNSYKHYKRQKDIQHAMVNLPMSYYIDGEPQELIVYSEDDYDITDVYILIELK